MPISDLATRNNVITSAITILIIGLIIYHLYHYIRKKIHQAYTEPILIKKVKNAKAPITFAAKDLVPSHNAYDGSYMIWLHVNDQNWNLGNKKHILSKGTELEVAMEERNNNIYVFLKKEDGDYITIKIENFPLQRWFHFAIVNTKQSSDIYIDGELYKSTVINGSIKSHAESDLSITKSGGFGGFISHLRYFNKALTPEEIKKIYSKGPNPIDILDIKNLIKRYTPSVNVDIKLGDLSLRETIKDEINTAKKDFVDPVVDNTVGALDVIDKATTL